MFISPATLNCIPNESYAVYGTGEAARELLRAISNRGMRLPDMIIQHQPNMSEFEGITVVDIDAAVANALPVVLGSAIFASQMKRRLLKATQKNLQIIDVFSPPPQHDYKIFCIGYGKTGTTSLEKALMELGYVMGNQAEAELLINNWAYRDFKQIIGFCETADAFQDVPFCLDFTYQALDAAYSGSKFILTIRDSSEQWFDSLVRFHTKKFSIDKTAPPTEEDLKRATYRYVGYAWKSFVYMYGPDSLYERKLYKAHYERHIASVKEYFRHRPGDLLVLNIGQKDTYGQPFEFLGKEPVREKFPWENKT